jgi:hypothetical protein
MRRARNLTLPASGLLVAAIATAVVVPSCSDPVHDQEVQALGPENPQIPPGEYHRAGQPCTVCHGPEGPAQTQFAIAGTIFWNAYSVGSVGYNNAYVSMIDANGQQSPPIYTNCVGNFWATPAAFNPAFPILVNIYPSGSNTPQVMFTQISRATSCAECHADPPNYNALGQVWIEPSTITPPDDVQSQTNCPADPNLADYSTGGLP